MEKKTLLALALSLLVLIGFQLTMSKMYPPKVVTGVVANKEATEALLENKQPLKIDASPAVDNTIQDIAGEENADFHNKLYSIVFSDIGGAVKKVTLNQNPKLGLNIPYDIFSAKNQRDYLFMFLPGAFGAELNNAKYSVSASDEDMIFTKTLKNGLTIEKKYHFYNTSYRIDLDITFKNTGNKDVTRSYSLICGGHLPYFTKDTRLLTISADLDGKILKDRVQSKPFEISKSGIINWVMLKDRYVSMITKPLTPAFGYLIKGNSEGVAVVGISSKEFEIPANSSVTHKYGIYAGLSDLTILKDSGIGADNALSYGFFGSISQLLVSALRFFHRIFRNWGVAIIVLSFFVNMLLFPLTRKSYKSMQEMQILQPKIHKIQEENKSNPQKMQKEIMELYKKHKVNPMGGCLPMLLQMPIFIALYQGLLNSVELRGAKFLWIKDLSTPENIHIPYTLPLIGSSFNILPILMLVGMFFQQKLSNKMSAAAQTPDQVQQQKMMSIMMTVMFAFIFWNFPSGLVLYWLVNTVVMVVYQLFYTKTPRNVEIYE